MYPETIDCPLIYEESHSTRFKLPSEKLRTSQHVLGKHKYVSFTDPSGGSSDSMTTAIGHREGDLIVVDCVREITAPFDPESAADEFVRLFQSYGIRQTNGDRYSAQWCAQAFQKREIEYRPSELPKSGLYLNFLPHLNGKTIRLLDIPRAINQIASLERRTARGGRDSVDHPPQGHDDVANAIAGLAFVAINRHELVPASFSTYGTPDPTHGPLTPLELEMQAQIPPCLIDFSKLQTKGTLDG